MQTLLVSTAAVAIAEIGDKTQLLALVLAARFQRPWPVIAGILAATVLNHAAAAWIGAWVVTSSKPGVTVDRVIAGSPAEGVLEAGDRILSVNGNRPAQGLGPELLGLKPGDEVTLTVERGGAVQVLKLMLADMSKAPSMWETPEKDGDPLGLL